MYYLICNFTKDTFVIHIMVLLTNFDLAPWKALLVASRLWNNNNDHFLIAIIQIVHSQNLDAYRGMIFFFFSLTKNFTHFTIEMIFFLLRLSYRKKFLINIDFGWTIPYAIIFYLIFLFILNQSFISNKQKILKFLWNKIIASWITFNAVNYLKILRFNFRKKK